MKKKIMHGFTLIELLSVLGLLALLVMVGLPIYIGLTNKSKENIYRAKVTELLAKAESYAEDKSVFVLDVDTLIKDGLISTDNENGNLIDPRSNRKMNCDIIEVNYEDNAYKARYIESNECLSKEELNNRYGMGYITIYDENNNEVEKNTWHKTPYDKCTFTFKNDTYLDNLESLTWYGEEEKTCSKENFDECFYQIYAETIKQTTIHLRVAMKIQNKEVIQNYETSSFIDNQKPEVLSIRVDNSNYTSDLRKVEVDITDFNGSGILEYAFVSTSSCDTAEYNQNKKAFYSTTITAYLDNGDYYVCLKDKAGNISDISEANKVHVEKVTSSSFNISLNNSSGDAWTNKDVTLGVHWTIDNLDFCATKIDNGSYERYNKTYEAKGFTYTPVFTGNQKKIVRFTCYDKAGNKSNEVTTNVMIDKDKPTIHYSVASQTAGSNGYYKNITLKGNVSDALSGISSIKYCEGENDCNPTTNATGSFNVKLNNGKNRKVCTIVTDKAGNSTDKVCSDAYNVDGVNPTISLLESSTAGSNGWVKTASITGNLGDTISGLSSAKYCKNTYNCTPNTNVSISNNKINVGITNASNQKVCLNVTDNAGNTSSTVCSRNYYADNTAPTVSISVSVSNSNVTVSANNAKDNLSGVLSYEYKLDNGSWISSSSSKYTYTNLTVGIHTFYVRTKDKAGNVSKEVYQSVNCGPSYSLKHTFDQYTKIIPLNSKQMLIVTGYSPKNLSNAGDYFESYTTIRIINVNTDGSISLGTETKVLTGEKGSGYGGVYATRIDDSHIMIIGSSVLKYKKSNGRQWASGLTYSVVEISGNSIKVIASKTQDYGAYCDYSPSDIACNGRTCNGFFVKNCGGKDYHNIDTISWGGGNSINVSSGKNHHVDSVCYPEPSSDVANRYGCPYLAEFKTTESLSYVTVGITPGVCLLYPTRSVYTSRGLQDPTINGTKYNFGYTTIVGTNTKVQKTGPIGRLSSNRFVIMENDTIYFYTYTNNTIITDSKTLKIPTVSCSSKSYSDNCANNYHSGKLCTERSFISAGDYLYLLVEGKYLYLIQG